ncbi:hypothetical protein ATANTOWER_023463, partial [Ataeniobius toweri]|nr:hypothetical protein [Ataeniobius toweri]
FQEPLGDFEAKTSQNLQVFCCLQSEHLLLQVERRGGGRGGAGGGAGGGGAAEEEEKRERERWRAAGERCCSCFPHGSPTPPADPTRRTAPRRAARTLWRCPRNPRGAISARSWMLTGSSSSTYPERPPPR